MGGEADRDDEAAAWFAALRGGPMSLERRTAFDAWRADPRNQAALDAMHELWGETAILKAAPRSAGKRRMLRPLIALAASLGLLAAGAVTFNAWSEREAARIVTAVGEQRTQALADGSVVAVNVASRLRVVDDDAERVVALEEGEAAFFVRSEPERPFVVRAGAYEIRALGTAFNVRLRGETLEVAVSEGEVAICALGAGPEQAFAVVGAGEIMRFPAVAPLGVAHSLVAAPIAPARVAEWRMRVITYEEAAVSDVVEDLNRFFARPVTIADSELAARRLTVRLEVTDRASAVDTLARMLDADVRVERRADVLSAAAPRAR